MVSPKNQCHPFGIDKTIPNSIIVSLVSTRLRQSTHRLRSFSYVRWVINFSHTCYKVTLAKSWQGKRDLQFNWSGIDLQNPIFWFNNIILKPKEAPKRDLGLLCLKHDRDGWSFVTIISWTPSTCGVGVSADNWKVSITFGHSNLNINFGVGQLAVRFCW